MPAPTPLLAALLLASGCATGAPSGDDVPNVPDSSVEKPDAGVDDARPDAWVPADAFQPADAEAPDSAEGDDSRVVILMIGDGMGRAHLQAASQYAHGSSNALRIQSLPVHGQLVTSSLSGVTDSAAAATAMATGSLTLNGRIGVDRDGQVVPNLVELAHQSGLSAGVVTTTALPHATPAGFSAHHGSREEYVEIADVQALEVRPDVMLGGGMQFYAPAGAGSMRDDGGLLEPLAAAGYQIVTTRTALAAATPDGDARLAGLFAPEHLEYTVDRPPDSTEPTLAEMSLAALTFLAEDPDGFFLVIEGGRIDMASHGNDLERAVTETVSFDEAVAAVADWAASRDDVTLVVTADHETGGLEVTTPGSVGVLPTVTWERTDHTNDWVDLFCSGVDCASFADQVRSLPWLHAVLRSRVTGQDLAEPPAVITPDGLLQDLRYEPVQQVVQTGFAVGLNQLEALHLDADRYGLALGIEGLFERDHNAVVVLLDVDFGQATGLATVAGALEDASGQVDAILSALNLGAPELATGFGADFALAVFGATDAHLEDLSDEAGLRGLVAPIGDPANLWWYGAAANFGEATRAAEDPLPLAPGRGLEVFIPWSALYPNNGGGVPAGAHVAMAAILVNDDGGYNSNQALPPFAPGTSNPGREVVPLPGVVDFTVDADSDGVADGNLAPSVW